MDFPPLPETKAGLEAMIAEYAARFETLLSELKEEQKLTVLRGWNVKDHLAHVIAWQRGAIAALEGRDFYDAVRGDVPLPAKGSFESLDDVNAALYEHFRDRPLAELMETWRSESKRLAIALQAVEAAALVQPCLSPGISQGRTLMEVVANNSCFHYLEHETWIREQLADRAAGRL